MNKINIEEKFNLFSDQWSPKIVAELNDSYIKLAKIKGEFTWHKHDDEDEMFYVVSGKLELHFENKTTTLNAGEFIVVEKGTIHMPVAKNEVKIMLIESKSTVNTGDVRNEKTVMDLQWI